MKLVECVPNFSEGKDKNIINAITNEIKKVEGVFLLDVDPGEAANRTVVTFIGEPLSVIEAAFNAIKKAQELIDMRKHRGEHPRMGATDVCPLVPVSEITTEEVVELSKKLAKRVGEELGIPVYLYENSALTQERKNLANIRKGEYEGLKDKMRDERWKPDFGPSAFNEKSGATVIGAREFLIAYNVNLNTRDRKLAHEIALNIREQGRAKRDENGKILRDENGKIIRKPGLLKNVKAIGWYIDEYGFAQVSINLTNYHITPLYKVYETVKEEAEKLGLRVIGSELVGLIPLEALKEVGEYYLNMQKRSIALPERDILHFAVLSLGLNQLGNFDIYEKVIEYRIAQPSKLVNMKINNFVDEISRESPAPGGGSVSALAGAIGAALPNMVINLSIGKKGYEGIEQEFMSLGKRFQHFKDNFLRLIDKDTEAFNKLMSAFKSKKDVRKMAVEEATKEATNIPLTTLEIAVKTLEIIMPVARKGNVNSISDAAVGALMCYASAEGAYYNVVINLNSIQDEDFVKTVKEKADSLLNRAKEIKKGILSLIDTKLGI